MAGYNVPKVGFLEFVKHNCNAIIRWSERIGEDNPKFTQEDAEYLSEALSGVSLFLSGHPAAWSDDNSIEDKMASSITRNQLLKMAEDLESPENETLLAANDEELDKVAESLVRAASHLREAADEMAEVEPEVGAITEEKLEQIAALAEAFSESDDELLQKQAGMLDDLLITLGSPKNAFLFTKAEEGDRIAELKKNYKDTAEKLKEYNKVSEAVKEIEKADVYKEYRPLEQGLSTRYCPDHAGVSAHRVGDHQIKCSLDGKVFDYNEGFTTQKGNKVPGTNVENQNMLDGHNTFSTFDSRADRMGFNNDQGSGNT